MGVENNILITKPKAKFNIPYNIMEKTGNILSLRSGFRTETTPAENKKSRNHFTLGAGYKFKKPVHLDLGFDFAKDYFSYSLSSHYQF